MFIYSMRAGTVRFFAIVCIALALLVSLVTLVPVLEPAAAAGGETVEEIRFDGIRSNEDRIAFLQELGWQVEQAPAESTTVSIPREFDKVFAAYNELQRAQGLDLAKYSGRTVERHTYVVTNYEGYEGKVLANLLVYRNRVIGGDICSADSSGFLQGLIKQAS